METNALSRSMLLRTSIVLLLLSFVVGACNVLPLELLVPATVDTAESTPAPTSTPEPTPKDICTGLFDLGVAVDGMLETDLVAVGVDGLLDEVNEALLELDALAAAVGEVYRPLVDDLSDVLVGLRDTLSDVADQRTLGASVATIGIAIAEIGVAMDALSLQLQEPCEGAVRWEPSESS